MLNQKTPVASHVSKKEYKYVPPPTVSILYEYVLRPFYQAVCPRMFPDFIHPNVITLGGWICAEISFCLLGYYSQWFTVTEGVPVW